MKTNIPYNVISISEMNRHKNSIRKEDIFYEELILDKETIKKLRASSSMFNKSVFIKIDIDMIQYNIESIHKSDGVYSLMLISNVGRAELVGREGEHPVIKSLTYIG